MKRTTVALTSVLLVAFAQSVLAQSAIETALQATVTIEVIGPDMKGFCKQSLEMSDILDDYYGLRRSLLRSSTSDSLGFGVRTAFGFGARG